MDAQETAAGFGGADDAVETGRSATRPRADPMASRVEDRLG